MPDTRNCDQCGVVFTPRREHARFCSPGCRVAWNRAHMADAAAEARALEWSITAMRDATGRLHRYRAWDRPRAFVLVGEAVWWVTIVDATLVRHHLDAYDGVMAAHPPVERGLIEGTLAGLRFVRNQMAEDVNDVDFIEPEAGHLGAGGGRITEWAWRLAPRPVIAPLAPRGRAWEMTRYRAYQAHLAGHTIGETFGRAAAFLSLAAANAVAVPNAGAIAGH
jgi:hypothetical protein